MRKVHLGNPRRELGSTFRLCTKPLRLVVFLNIALALIFSFLLSVMGRDESRQDFVT